MVAGLLMAGVAVGVTSGAVSAAPGTMVTTNACFSNATVTYSDLNWTLTGNAIPSIFTLGTAGGVTLTGATVAVDVPATLLIAGYNLGLLVKGANAIPVTTFVARQATNVDIGGGVKGTLVKKDNFIATVSTTITDPDGIPATGDETATPLAINQSLPDWTVTPLGGDVAFSQGAPGSLGSVPGVGAGGAAVAAAGSLYASASVGGGLIKANFDCSPGVTIPTTGVAGTSGTTFTPAAVIPFENVSVVAPPTAPVCTGLSSSVGVGQTVSIDLSTACSDVNQGQGGGSPFTFTFGAIAAGGGSIAPGPTANTFIYTAPPVDPGAPVIISFTATDTTGLVSNTANITVQILANSCDATGAACNLQQIVVQPVVGTTMTMTKNAGLVVMSPVALNGQPQVSTGAIQTITVTNARGTAAGWSVTAYATDLGVTGSPTFTVPGLGITLPLCSNAGAGPFLGSPAAPTAASDRLCIPGDNLGWTPTAVVTHSTIPGDVATVAPGLASATGVAPTTDAQAWLAALEGRREHQGSGSRCRRPGRFAQRQDIVLGSDQPLRWHVHLQCLPVPRRAGLGRCGQLHGWFGPHAGVTTSTPIQ